MYKTFFKNIAEKVQHLPFGGVAKIKEEMLMTKEKDTQIIVRNFTEKGGFMIVPHLALFEFGCAKGLLLFALISKFQDSYIEETLTERGSFCCTQAEIERKTGINPRKQTKLVKELQEDRLISCYYSNVGLRRLKWFYFTKSNFKNIDKRLSEAKERLEREKEQEAHKNMVDVEGVITSQTDLSFLKTYSA